LNRHTLWYSMLRNEDKIGQQCLKPSRSWADAFETGKSIETALEMKSGSVSFPGEVAQLAIKIAKTITMIAFKSGIFSGSHHVAQRSGASPLERLVGRLLHTFHLQF